MSSKYPKNAQFKKIFKIHNNIGNGQNNKEMHKQLSYGDSKEEFPSHKKGLNPPQPSEGNLDTTMNSSKQDTQQGILDISNVSNMPDANVRNDITQEKYQIYSFNKDYLNEVCQNLILEENRFYQKINYNYMTFQKNINYKMRAILIDWLIYVHYRFNMKRKTLFQCVFIIDAYLSKILLKELICNYWV